MFEDIGFRNVILSMWEIDCVSLAVLIVQMKCAERNMLYICRVCDRDVHFLLHSGTAYDGRKKVMISGKRQCC